METFLLAGWVHNLCEEMHVKCEAGNTASGDRRFKHFKRETGEAVGSSRLDRP
jgi:hypothetical protein